jgi:hypothetical protein
VGDTVRASAVVTLTLEIDMSQPWSADCTISEVHRIAMQEYPNAIAGLASCLQAGRVRVIGTPKVKSIITRQED